MKAWLDQRPGWQFALLWAGSQFLGILLGAAIMRQFIRPFLGFGYVTGYAAVFSSVTALVGTWSRKGRLRTY